MEQAYLATLPCFGRELDRLAVVAQGRLGHRGRREPSLGRPGRARGEGGRVPRRARAPGRRRTIASSDLPWTASTRATSARAATSSGEGPSGSSNASASTCKCPLAGITQPTNHSDERAHRAGGSGDLTGRTEGRDRFLQCLGCLGVATGLQSGLAEAGECLGSFGMSGRSERERPFEVRERRGGIQPERTLPGEGQELQGRCFELGGLLGLSGGLRQLQRGGVVVGEHVGEVLDPLGSSRLDPPGRGDVTGGSRGSGELTVRDVASQDVPEGVFGLALDRGTPSGTDELLARELPERVGDRREIALAHLRRSHRPRTPSRRPRRRRASTSCRPRACRGARRSTPAPSRGTGPPRLLAAPSSRPS